MRFLHIPKTAGTSFTEILLRQYDDKGHFVFSGDLEKDIERYKRGLERGEEISLFLGHAPIETGIEDADSASVITFLRDPVARVKSFCQHVYEGKSPYLLESFPPEDFDLDRFLDSGNPELSNLHTKMLTGSGSFMDGSHLERLSPSEAVDMALENLYTRVDAYGLQEYFDESLIHFKKKFSWHPPYYIRRNRKSAIKRLAFEKRHIEKIEELNRLDMELYGKAKIDFMKIVKGTVDSDELTAFRRANAYMGPLIGGGFRVRNLIRRYLPGVKK
jgi:hypothetical protein